MNIDFQIVLLLFGKFSFQNMKKESLNLPDSKVFDSNGICEFEFDASSNQCVSFEKL